jgi:hypothetical protein
MKELPMDRNLKDRCYMRGLTLLGLLNTAIGCVFNRVLVRGEDDETGKTVFWRWDKATDWPEASE